MNKKIVGFMLSMTIMAILTIPVLGATTAGKGTTKQEFVFSINGASIYMSEDRAVLSPPPPDHEPKILHIKGQEFAGEFSIIIGPSGSPVETIPNDCIVYDCELNYNYNFETGQVTGVLVRETISIYNSEEQLRGTVELKATGQGQASFVGFGTGEFEGINVKGFTEAIVPNRVMNRIGTVMGWPTS